MCCAATVPCASHAAGPGWTGCSTQRSADCPTPTCAYCPPRASASRLCTMYKQKHLSNMAMYKEFLGPIVPKEFLPIAPWKLEETILVKNHLVEKISSKQIVVRKILFTSLDKYRAPPIWIELNIRSCNNLQVTCCWEVYDVNIFWLV